MSAVKHLVSFYEQTESELMQAKLLPEATLKMVKNLHATDFLARSNLVPDPNNYNAYVQKHAELSGAITAWQMLIDAHEDTVRQLNIEGLPSQSV